MGGYYSFDSDLITRTTKDSSGSETLNRLCGVFWVSQTVDPLIWGPILLRVLYRNPH